MDGSSIVLTDSGGIQEETTVLGIPCITLREQTERPITLTEGTNHLAPWPVTVEGLLGTYRTALEKQVDRDTAPRPEGWDGRASERIVEALSRA
jgi:UDP-N-acetylglucosamine 2-epimerase (non-hydrolysing)